LSLVELLLASTIMLMLAGALGVLAMSAQTAAEYGHGHGTATQHGRVCLERIERAIAEAHASEQFPGCAVFAESVGSWDFPDTLVVWKPTSAAVDPDGLPRFNELVIFCPDPDAPHRLLEVTVPGDTRTAYAADDTSSWQAALAAIKADDTAERVELTDMLRTADAGDGAQRAAARFCVTVRPSLDEWSDYEAGDLDWDEVNWVQDIHGTQTGLRQAWCRFEIQLLPEGIAGKSVSDELALPLFGSAAVYCELEK
jgi:hypothetical protein